MDQNYFKFKEKFYKQNFGATMGNNLSLFLADIFLTYFENLILDQNLEPKYYKRYVDDIFCIIKKNKIDSFFNEVNSKFTTIKFTMELENNNRQNFLDLTIIRENKN